MVELQIARAHTRYRVAQRDVAVVGRLDALCRISLGDAVALLLRARGLSGGELCIRAVEVKLRVRAGASEAEILAAWADATAGAIEQALAARSDDVAVYASLTQALVDLVSAGDARRHWAWSRLELVDATRDPVAHPLEAVEALVRRPTEILPVLRELARRRRLGAFLRRTGASRALAALARQAQTVLAPDPELELRVQAASRVFPVAPPGRGAEAGLGAVELHASRILARSELLAEHPVMASAGAAGADAAHALAILALLEVDRGAALAPERAAATVIELGRRFADAAGHARHLKTTGPATATETRRDPAHGVTEPPPVAAVPRSLERSVARRPASMVGLRSRDAALARVPAPMREPSRSTPTAPTAVPREDHAAAAARRPSALAPSPGPTTREPVAVPALGRPDTPPVSAPGAVAGDDGAELASETSDAFAETDGRLRGVTRHGGLLFLLHVVREERLFERLATAPALEQRTLAWALHRLALELAGPLLVPDDPAALAFAGVQPGLPSPSEREPSPSGDEGAFLADVAAAIVDAAARRLEAGRGTRSSVARLLTRDAEIVADTGWFDVSFALEDATPEVRRAGLDWDLGFLPWLGVVVRFHYV